MFLPSICLGKFLEASSFGISKVYEDGQPWLLFFGPIGIKHYRERGVVVVVEQTERNVNATSISDNNHSTKIASLILLLVAEFEPTAFETRP